MKKRYSYYKFLYTGIVLFIEIIIGAIPVELRAQTNEIYNESIASLQVVAGNDWLSLPIAQLNDVPITISFDYLSHEYQRFSYTIEHCEADWTTSKNLFSSDYIEGFSEGNTIDNVQKSINTKVQYTHYRIQIPNEKCQIKMSGNYRLTVYDENNDNQKVLSACFMIVESVASIHLNVTTNTDLDINGRYQQLAMEVKYGSLPVTNPTEQIKTLVMQNGRFETKRVNSSPQFILPDGLKWEHNKEYIFDAGNEYRKFETLDVNHTTMGLEKVSWDGNDYHAFIWTDEPRRSYVYDEDANGSFYIRNSDNWENNTSSEYQIVHFRLLSSKLDGRIFVNGTWTNGQFIPEYELIYNDESMQYEASVLLKQGYYSYQYLLKQPNGNIAFVPSEGSFYQTENQYQALLYFKSPTDRADRLVGYQKITYK